MLVKQDSFNTDSTKKTNVGLWSKTKSFVQSSSQGVKCLRKKKQMISGPYA